MESNRWLVVAFLAGGLLIGAAAYTVGLSQGAAHAAVAASGSADAVDAYAHWGWGRHAYWNWGFPFGGILALLFWIWIFRILMWGIFRPWGWGWRRRWRYDDYYDDPRWFDEWHRRAHQRDNGPRKSEV